MKKYVCFCDKCGEEIKGQTWESFSSPPETITHAERELISTEIIIFVTERKIEND